MDTTQDTINELINGLIFKLENIFIKGLSFKGFYFDDKLKFENFIINRCRCEDNKTKKQRIYFVDEIPFLLHNYSVEIDLKPVISDNLTTISANYGTFVYL